MKRKHLGSNFEDFLAGEGLLEECRAAAIKFRIARDPAVEDRRRTLYLEGVNADYAALSPQLLAELEKEIDMWDVTSLDGLEEQ